MGSHLNGKHLSRLFVLEKTFPHEKYCWIIVSKRKLGRNPRPIGREVIAPMPYLVKRRRAKVKDPTRVR